MVDPPLTGSMKVPGNTRATLVGLLLGLALGLSLRGGEIDVAFVDLAASVGEAWAYALRLIVVPLVICLLIAGLGGAPGRKVGRIGALSVAVFLALQLAASTLSVTTTPVLIEWLGVPSGVLVGVGASSAPGSSPNAADWLRSLTDGSFGRALARGELLPLIMLALVAAVALRQVEERSRLLILRSCSAVLALLMVVLSWILRVTPVAVFALAFSMAASKGLPAAHVVGSFILILIVLLTVLSIALYPIASSIGRVSLRRFGEAALPAQAVAVSTRSSLASLPALLVGGERLALPATVIAFVMPLSVSVFKASRMISGPAKMLFLAHVYGIEMTGLGIAAYVAFDLLLSVGTPGTPNGGAHPSTAALLAIGVPMEGIAIVHVVYALPDVFMTLTNVTADLAAAAIVARLLGKFEATVAPALASAPA